MKNKKQDKQLEKLLFEVYEKGVKQQDCNLTEYIEKVKQALRIHDVVGRSEQLKAFLSYIQQSEKEGETIINNDEFIEGYLKSL
jgi:murein L,D-transpeptidase YcbB/YkuD